MLKWTFATALLLATIAGVAIPATRPSQDEILDRLRQIENLRLIDHQDLVDALNSSDELVMKTALRTVARFGEPKFREAVVRQLRSKSSEIRAEAAFAAGMINQPELLSDVTAAMALEDDVKVTRELAMALGRIGTQNALTALEMEWGSSQDVTVKAGIAQAMGLIFLKVESEQWLLTRSSLVGLWQAAAEQDEVLAQTAAFALARYRPLKQLSEQEVQNYWKDINHPAAKALATRYFAKFPTATTVAWINSRIAIPNEVSNIRIELARVLGRMPLDMSRDRGLCIGLLRPDPALQVAALQVMEASVPEALGTCHGSVVALAQGSSHLWVQAQALGTLVSLDKTQRMSWVQRGINSISPLLVRAVLSRAAKVTDPLIRPIVLQSLSNNDSSIVGDSLTAIKDMPADWMTGDFTLSIEKLMARRDFVLTALGFEVAEKFKWQEFISIALKTLQGDWKEDEYDAIVAALRFVGVMGGMQHLKEIEPFLKHGNRFVVEAAVTAYKNISGTAPREVPRNHLRVVAETPKTAAVVAALKKRLVLETSVGNFTLEAYGSAPLCYMQFLTLAEKGFFTNVLFHRVVPNFVAQGGDPRGDGWGGSGYLIRDEVSPERHVRGTVGLATGGKDTGSSQLFINLGPNLHLDGQYTLFARVVEGKEFIDRIEVGTKILQAYVK